MRGGPENVFSVSLGGTEVSMVTPFFEVSMNSLQFAILQAYGVPRRLLGVQVAPGRSGEPAVHAISTVEESHPAGTLVDGSPWT